MQVNRNPFGLTPEEQKELEERRKPKFVVRPEDVAPKDDVRVRQWGLSIMKKHLSRLDDKHPDGTIVFEKEVEPEEIDIMNIYPFAKIGDMRYFIMRNKPYWCLRLLYKRPTGPGYSILAELRYLNVDGI